MGSSDYNNVKKKDIVNCVKRIVSKNGELSLEPGSKHFLKLIFVRATFGRPYYPLNINANKVDCGTVQELMKWLTKNNICTKKEFDDFLGK